MKIERAFLPKSSFLAQEKDMNIICDQIYQNNRLKKLLYYTSPDALDRESLTEEQTSALFGKQIKIVPKLIVDGSVLNYIMITFDSFTPNGANPEFRDNTVEFDIICHYDQWPLQDYQLRPYRIAAELDAMFNNKHLTGIGELKFLGATQIMLTDEFAGLCLMYQAIHGEEDKKFMPNPKDEDQFIKDFESQIHLN